MRQDMIDKINARLELAQERHGEFEHKAQVLDAIQLEIAEARYAFDWQSRDRFVAELLDVATVAIRAAEQFSGAETEAVTDAHAAVDETREQWIEREARKARARYWGLNTWDTQSQAHKKLWRKVVAPFYQEPVADADTLEKLAEVARKANGQGYDTEYVVAAVLRAAKPEVVMGREDMYDIVFILDHLGVDVADSTKLALASINSRIRYRFELPQPEPLRVPVDVEALADTLRRKAGWADPEWEESSLALKEAWRKQARAALAYLNIEPCAKPEYNPDDVALTPNNVNITGADPSRMVFFINGKQLVSQSALDNALAKIERQRNQLHAQCKTIESRGAELENLRAECKRLRHEVEVERDRANDLLDDKNSAEAECERLRSQQPETRPAKIRFDVTAEDLAAKIHHALHGGWPEFSQEIDRTKAVWIDTAKIAMDYLAAHAVLEVPPGVPSIWKLSDIGTNAYYSSANLISNDGDDHECARAAAIRDAVLAGIQRREWTEQDELRDDERVTSELFEAACNDLGDAQDKLARIAALVRPIPVAELVDAGTEAPRLLAERHRQIRAILEDESNE